jgi:crotonobetainyl-CoA:carnitine CoA-transferase CaiB-like acyl-CoA transferase
MTATESESGPRAALSLPRLAYDPQVTGPLAGVTVVDLSRLVSGGQLGLVLGDLGAEVIKVEPPGTGDALRYSTADGFDAYWRTYGRNKRSVTLDLRSPRGHELLDRLLDDADLLTENFTPGVLEKIVGPMDELLERHPKLVVVRITGWGQTGPRAQLPGFGTLAEAFSGFTFLNGESGGSPLPPPLSLADTFAGTYAASAAIAALYNVRANGGAGQVIDISLFEPLFSVMGPDSTAYAESGARRYRGEGTKVSSVRGSFETSDGKWVVISAATPDIAARFFSGIGRADVLVDERFATPEGRLQHRDALNAVLAEEFARRTFDEIMVFAREHRVTIGPVYNIVDILDDEHYKARSSVVEMVDAQGDGVVVPAPVPRFSKTPATIRTAAPALGQDNDEVYARLGLSVDEIAALAEEGVI